MKIQHFFLTFPKIQRNVVQKISNRELEDRQTTFYKYNNLQSNEKNEQKKTSFKKEEN